MEDGTPDRSKLQRLSGGEPIHAASRPVGGTVLDFWRWSASDLLSNATRGRLAEYLVQLAVGGAGQAVRSEWDAFDLTTPEGIKVEVKSAAYVQSWTQRRLSCISFGIAPTRAWSADTGLYAEEVRRQADVYVFALLHHQDRESVDPLDVRQWTFHVISTARLNQRIPAQRSIRLSILRTIADTAVSFEELGVAISESVRNQPAGQ